MCLCVGFSDRDVKSPFSVLGPRLALCMMGDGALLYKRQKSRCALSQAEVVFQVLREGVQSAHSLIPALFWAGGDSLKELLDNCTGEHQPLQKVLQIHRVRMPQVSICLNMVTIDHTNANILDFYMSDFPG